MRQWGRSRKDRAQFSREERGSALANLEGSRGRVRCRPSPGNTPGRRDPGQKRRHSEFVSHHLITLSSPEPQGKVLCGGLEPFARCSRASAAPHSPWTPGQHTQFPTAASTCSIWPMLTGLTGFRHQFFQEVIPDPHKTKSEPHHLWGLILIIPTLGPNPADLLLTH